MICRNCKKKNFDKISNIGNQPISSLFLRKKIKIKNYSLDLYKCNLCNLVQLSKIPNERYVWFELWLQNFCKQTYGKSFKRKD